MSKLMLTTHKDKVFESQTMVLSGHAFMKCRFNNCTLVVTNSPMLLNKCNFQNCNWRLEYDILWGNKASVKLVKQLIDLLDGADQDEISSIMH
ncbi:hypothetical protein BVY03_02100 [bacterium K02(2017)]|nr:hypothetical protein BVY03_02100 [bacterium K02(2017)]